MNKPQAKQYIKDNLESYLQGQDINTNKPFTCLNPDHEDKHPSMSYDPAREKVHCFSCGADYDTFDLIGIQYRINNPADIFKKAYDLFNITLEGEEYHTAKGQINLPPQTPKKSKPEEKPQADQSDYLAKAHSLIGETDYPQQRGLSQATIDYFKLGYDPSFKTTMNRNKEYTTWKALIIPTSNSSYTVRNTDPNADKEDRIKKRGSSPLFNLQALEGDKPVFIVEGEIDAMSIYEAGGQAIGLGSTGNYHSLIEHLESFPPKQPILLLLALDKDTVGRDTTDKLERDLTKLGIPSFKVDIVGDYKDPNEALQANKEALIQRINYEIFTERINYEIFTEKEIYQRTSAGAKIISFIDGIHANADTPSIPTGFEKLDNILDGGLYEGLYIVGAISSLGKTTLITQIADQIAQGGQDILLFSLEMAETEIMAKSISRHSLINCKGNNRNAKTTRGITDGKRWKQYSLEEKTALNQAAMEYGEYANDRIYIHEGIGNIGVEQIRLTVAIHKRVTGNNPVVIIDYVQILAPYENEKRATDKQNTDKAVMELKRISRDYKIPVIGISSFNRANYSNSVSMEAFKESGAIEYSSDVLIGLQLEGVGRKTEKGKPIEFDVDAAKRADPRVVQLKILKNRNGRSGDTVTYDYYPAYNYFKEA